MRLMSFETMPSFGENFTVALVVWPSAVSSARKCLIEPDLGVRSRCAQGADEITHRADGCLLALHLKADPTGPLRSPTI
jgi:hypothetical protein